MPGESFLNPDVMKTVTVFDDGVRDRLLLG